MKDKEKNTQLDRIAHMNEIYEKGGAAVEDVLQAARRYLELESEIRTLDDYYQSPLWLSDFDDDNNGKIPKDINRSILTEDAIWDLLTDEARMVEQLGELIERYRSKTEQP